MDSQEWLSYNNRRHFFDPRQNFFHAHFRAAVESICGVAPGAAQIASGQPDENARQARSGAFALDRPEDFRDHHDAAIGSHSVFCGAGASAPESPLRSIQLPPPQSEMARSRTPACET
jgi:hypothetical protein